MKMNQNVKKYIDATPTVHDLIIVGIEGLEEHEKLKDFRIDMSTYFYYNSYTKLCHVCLGGVFMSRACPGLLESAKRSMKGVEENLYIARRRQALDEFRKGDVTNALSVLRIDQTMEDFLTTDYDHNPSLFKTEMLCLAEYLREFDLKIRGPRK